MRKPPILPPVALLAMLALTPAPADAQLATFCDSPAASWCFSVTQFDYVEAVDGTLAGFDDFAFTLAGVWSGSGLGAVTSGMWYYDLSSGSDDEDRFPGLAAFVPGVLTSATASTLVAPATWSPSLDDLVIGWYSLGSDRGTGFCAVGENGCFERAVSVPEPGSVLLMATGLLGLGWARRRRKDVV